VALPLANVAQTQKSVGGGEKGYQFGGQEGTTCVVTQWTSTASRGPWIVVLVALRQLSLPYGNRAFLRRGRRYPYDLRSARLSQAKSSSFFTGH
jgi:hypothetical protein